MDAKNLAVLQELKRRIVDEPEKPEPKPGAIDPAALLRLLTKVSLNINAAPKDRKRPRSKKHLARTSPTANTNNGQAVARTKPSTPWPSNEVFRGKSGQKDSGKNQSPFGIKPIHAPIKTSKAKGGKCLFRGVAVSQTQYKALKESLALMIYGNDHKFLKRKFDALSFYLAEAKDDYEAAEVYEKIAKMLISGKTGKPVADIERERRNTLIKADVARLVKSINMTKKVVDKDAPEWRKRHCELCHAEFFIRRDWTKPPARCKKCRDSLHDAKAAYNKKSKKSGRTVYSHYVIYSGGSPGLGKRH